MLLCNSFSFMYKVNTNLVLASLNIYLSDKTARFSFFSNIYNFSVSQLQYKLKSMSKWSKNLNLDVYGSSKQ
jgi:hypothetical protein